MKSKTIILALFAIFNPCFGESSLKRIQLAWEKEKNCASIIDQCHCETLDHEGKVQPYVASAYISYFFEGHPKKALEQIQIAKSNLEKLSLTNDIKTEKLSRINSLITFFEEKYTTTRDKLEKINAEEVSLWEEGNHPKQINIRNKYDEQKIEFILYESPFSLSIKEFKDL